jgi:hypothetical protein
MKICFDIDGVLFDQVAQEYRDAVPNQSMIDLLNRLYDRRHRIVLHTSLAIASRFIGHTQGNREEAERIGREFTERQLAAWGVRYHELWMGKPRFDYVIDDRSVFYDPDCARIEAVVEERAGAGPR